MDPSGRTGYSRFPGGAGRRLPTLPLSGNKRNGPGGSLDGKTDGSGAADTWNGGTGLPEIYISEEHMGYDCH